MKALVLAAVAAAGTFVPTLHPGDTVPPLPLVDQDGREFSLAALRGNAVVVSFLYTGCTDARECPLVAAKFARMQRAIGTAPVRLVAVTVNPVYDTPPVLHAYGAAYRQDPRRWTLATGKPAVVAQLATRLGVDVRRSAGGALLHTDDAVVLDPDGRIATIVDGVLWSPDDLLARAKSTAGRPLAPLAVARLWLDGAVALCGGSSAPITAAASLGILAAITAAFGFLMRRALRG